MKTITLEEHFSSDEEMEDIHNNRIQWMDNHNISMQILSYGNQNPQIADPKFSIEFTKLANDELAKAVATVPDRYRAFASLPVSHPHEAADELKRTVEELGFKGAMLVRPTSQEHPFLMILFTGQSLKHQLILTFQSICTRHSPLQKLLITIIQMVPGMIKFLEFWEQQAMAGTLMLAFK